MAIEETIDGVRVGMTKVFLVEEVFRKYAYTSDPKSRGYGVACWSLDKVSTAIAVHCFAVGADGRCPVEVGELVVGKCIAVGPNHSFSLWEKIDEKEEESDGLA